MKTKLHVSVLLIICAFISKATADLIVHEIFAYEAGSDLNGQAGGVGFASSWEAFNTIVTDTGLLYSPGSSLPATAIGGRYLSSILTSGTFYFGFSAQNTNGGDSRASIGFGYYDFAGDSQQFVAVQQAAGGATWELVIEEGDKTASAAQDSASTPFSTASLTYFVLKITMSQSDDSAVIDLFVNPTSSIEPSIAAASVSGTLSRIDMLSGSANLSSPTAGTTLSTYLALGHLIGATTFSEVVFVIPEPSLYAAIAGLVFLGVASIRRFLRAFPTEL